MRARATAVFLLTIASAGFALKESDAAARLAVEQYYAAYAQANAEEALSFWSATSPERATAEKTLKDAFAANEKIRLNGVKVVQLAPSASDRVRVRADVSLAALDKKTGKESTPLGLGHRTIQLVREAGVWKISSDVASEELLADQLVAKDTNAERNELLSANQDLMTVDLRKALNRRANKSRAEGKYDRAIAIFEFIIDFAERIGDVVGVGGTWVNIGFAYRSQGQYDRALTAMEKSLVARQKVGDKGAISNSISQLGSIYILQGEYEKALEEYRKALPLVEEAGDKTGIASTLNGLGQVYRQQGDLTSALATFERTLRMVQETGNPFEIARSLNAIAEIYQTQGSFDLAIEYYQKALEAGQQSNEKAYVTETMLQNIGQVNFLRGNYAQAMENYQRALQVNEALGDQHFAAVALHDISLLHSSQGNYDAAMTFARRSLELQERLGDKAGIVGSMMSVAGVYRRQGQTDLAIQTYEKAKVLADEIGNKSLLTDLLLGLAGVYRDRGDHERAKRFYAESLALAESVGDKPKTTFSLLGTALVDLDVGDFENALQFADRGAEIARALGSLEDVWQTRTAAGRALRGLGRTDEARRALDDAIGTIETLRGQLAGGEQDEQRFFEGRVAPYHAMIDLLVEQRNHADAFQYAERAKARVLLDTLQRGRVDVTKAMTAEEMARERTLRTQIVSANRRITAEMARDRSDPKRLAVLKTQLTDARGAYESFQNRIYALHPDLRVKRGDVHLLMAKEIPDLLPDSSTAMLEYVLTEKHSYLFVLSRDSQMSVIDLKVKPDDLRKRIDDFRGRIARRDLDFRDSARALFDLLIAPARKQLAGKTKLIVIPDGSLWELPFQALVTPGKRFFVEELALSYAPSGTTLREMMQKESAVGKPSRDRVLLAFGNPSISGQTATRAKSVLMDETLDPLPEAERQVQTLGEYYGPKSSTIYVGADAREERLKSEAKKFRIVQLATHGILNNASPMYSHVVLAQSKEGSEEDGLLEAWEMMNLDLNADLVVLSACETARGRIGTGEGVVGMSWALFVAGVPSIVVSQWKVESSSTTDLMLEFHRNLTRAKDTSSVSKARAMQRASLSLLKSSRYRHPFYWAGFVVVGDPR